MLQNHEGFDGIGIDSHLPFGYNDKNVYANVYVIQYTRFLQGNP
jgi:hypothetical protein